jgi:hypothetical protein
MMKAETRTTIEEANPNHETAEPAARRNRGIGICRFGGKVIGDIM